MLMAGCALAVFGIFLFSFPIFFSVFGITLATFPQTVAGGVTFEIDSLHSSQINMITDFGLVISMRPGYGQIILEDPFATNSKDLLCGACGRHNYDSTDNDFTWADGTQFPRLGTTSRKYVHQDYYEPYLTTPNTPAG